MNPKAQVKKNMCALMFIAAQLTTAQVPISRPVEKKLWYIYTMQYYTVVKKKKNICITVWDSMEEPEDDYAK